MSLVPFLFLAPPDASVFMGRWKPQLLAGNLVSTSGVNAYSRARIALNDPTCVGMLVNARNVGFVLVSSAESTNAGAYDIACCLWPMGTPSLQEFRDLREWCEGMVPDAHVGADRLDDEVERDLWHLSVLDA